jgi:hypothetical protein
VRLIWPNAVRKCGSCPLGVVEEEMSVRLDRKRAVVEILLRCKTCSFVVKQPENEAEPLYCPNCAIHHLKGDASPPWELVKMEDFEEQGGMGK